MREIDLTHPQCEYCGRMLFPGESQVRSEEGSFCTESARQAREAGTPPDQVDCPFNVWAGQRSIEPDAGTDPVTLAVIDGALQAICAEMSHTMVRTAHSPVFFEGNDFTVGLFDANFERIAQREGLRLDQHRDDRAESEKGIVRLRSLTIQLLAIYGSDDYPIGVERRFLIRDLDEGRLLVPATWDSKRLTSRRHRKQVRQLIQDLAREEARN